MCTHTPICTHTHTHLPTLQGRKRKPCEKGVVLWLVSFQNIFCSSLFMEFKVFFFYCKYFCFVLLYVVLYLLDCCSVFLLNVWSCYCRIWLLFPIPLPLLLLEILLYFLVCCVIWVNVTKGDTQKWREMDTIILENIRNRIILSCSIF
jgi:hypothetical protein